MCCLCWLVLVLIIVYFCLFEIICKGLKFEGKFIEISCGYFLLKGIILDIYKIGIGGVVLFFIMRE